MSEQEGFGLDLQGFNPFGGAKADWKKMAALSLGGFAGVLTGLLGRRLKKEKGMDPTKRHMIMAAALTLISKELDQGKTVALNDAMIERSVQAGIRLVNGADAAIAGIADEEDRERRQTATKAFGLARQEVMRASSTTLLKDFCVQAFHKETGEIHGTILQADTADRIREGFEEHGCSANSVEEIFRPLRFSSAEREGMRTMVQHAEAETGWADDDSYVGYACKLIRQLAGMDPRLRPEDVGGTF